MPKRESARNLEALKKLFRRLGFVRTAYIFGSIARKDTGPLSDIDIAVVLDSALPRRRMKGIKLELIGKISKAIGSDEFDLVVMNDAPLLLKYNIIKEGIVLKSDKERVLMETRIISYYLDRKYYDDMYNNLSLEGYSKRGIL